MSKAHPGTSVIVPFIYIAAKENKGSKPSRILLPKTLKELKRSAKKALKLQNEIEAIYDDTGALVNDVKVIIPGSMLYLSHLPPGPTVKIATLDKKQEKAENKPITIDKKVTERAKIFGGIQQSTVEVADDQPSGLTENYESESYASDSYKTDDEDEDIISNDHKDEIENEDIHNDSQDEQNARKSNIPKPRRKSNDQQKEFTPVLDDQAYRQLQQEIFEEEEEEELNEYDSDRLKYATEHDVESHPTMGDTSQAQEPKYEEEEEEEEEEEDRPPVESLINMVLPKGSFSDKLEEVLNSLPKEYQTFLENARDIEVEQGFAWLASMFDIISKENLSYQTSKVDELEEYKKQANKFIQSHQISMPGGTIYSFKAAVVGPSKSGKSTYLSVILRQFMYSLVATNSWKETFVFMMDAVNIAPYSNEPDGLFSRIVALAMPQFAAQMPEIAPYVDMLTKYFTRITTDGYLSILSRRFIESPQTSKIANACKIVGTNLVKCWNHPDCRDDWYTSVFQFPTALAKELGFKDTIMVVDNIDLFDIMVDSSQQFPESEGSSYIFENLKESLSFTNFLISCKDCDHFEQCLTSTTNDGIDLIMSITFISVLDLECTPKYEDKEIVLQFDQDETILKMTASHFGDSPSYLLLWQQLNEVFDQIDSYEEDSEEYEDGVERSLMLGQEIFQLLYTTTDEFGFVTDIKRKTLKSQH